MAAFCYNHQTDSGFYRKVAAARWLRGHHSVNSPCQCEISLSAQKTRQSTLKHHPKHQEQVFTTLTPWHSVEITKTTFIVIFYLATQVSLHWGSMLNNNSKTFSQPFSMKIIRFYRHILGAWLSVSSCTCRIKSIDTAKLWEQVWCLISQQFYTTELVFSCAN